MSVQRTQTNQTNREEIIKEGLGYLNDFCTMVVYIPAIRASLVYLTMVHHVLHSLYREENQQDIREAIDHLIAHIGQLTIGQPNVLNFAMDKDIDLSISITNWYLTNIALMNASSEGFAIAIDSIDIIINEPAFAKAINNILLKAEEQSRDYTALLTTVQNLGYTNLHSQIQQPVWGGGLYSNTSTNPYLT